jgi:probable phosphoglycerate mutase
VKWIGLVRHGESTGNVARAAAEAGGLEVIDIAPRDADVPLTERGAEQARAVGAWLAETPPDVVVASTYLRAAETARLAMAAAELPGEPLIDERLRDRELGVLDLLTERGVTNRYPQEQARKVRLGKFYYRPPGGESWADIVLRLRSLLDELHRRFDGRRVVLFGHEMTVFALRYILEGVPEPELMHSARRTSVANASITAWEPDGGGRYRMVLAQHVGHLPPRG